MAPIGFWKSGKNHMSKVFYSFKLWSTVKSSIT